MDLDAALSTLRVRNQPVPLPPRLPSRDEVDAAEAKLGRSFPPDFQRYLLEASDVVVGVLEPVTITDPTSHTDLFGVLNHARALGVPDDLLPICEDNANFYCMNDRGEVVFWDHNGWSSEKWPSLAEWINRVWIDQG